MKLSKKVPKGMGDIMRQLRDRVEKHDTLGGPAYIGVDLTPAQARWLVTIGMATLNPEDLK